MEPINILLGFSLAGNIILIIKHIALKKHVTYYGYQLQLLKSNLIPFMMYASKLHKLCTDNDIDCPDIPKSKTTI